MCFAVLPGTKLIENMCAIKNFKEALFNDFKQLVVMLKVNPQKFNWRQKT